VEHHCGLFDIALVDMREREISEDDHLRLVPTLMAARGSL
jgi:hypothetical protein